MVRSGSSGATAPLHLPTLKEPLQILSSTLIVFLLSVDHAEHQQHMIRWFGCSSVLTSAVYFKVKGKRFIQVSSIEMIGSPLPTNGHQLFVIHSLCKACLSCAYGLKRDPVRTLVKLEAPERKQGAGMCLWVFPLTRLDCSPEAPACLIPAAKCVLCLAAEEQYPSRMLLHDLTCMQPCLAPTHEFGLKTSLLKVGSKRLKICEQEMDLLRAVLGREPGMASTQVGKLSVQPVILILVATSKLKSRYSRQER